MGYAVYLLRDLWMQGVILWWKREVATNQTLNEGIVHSESFAVHCILTLGWTNKRKMQSSYLHICIFDSFSLLIQRVINFRADNRSNVFDIFGKSAKVKKANAFASGEQHYTISLTLIAVKAMPVARQRMHSLSAPSSHFAI